MYQEGALVDPLTDSNRLLKCSLSVGSASNSHIWVVGLRWRGKAMGNHCEQPRQMSKIHQTVHLISSLRRNSVTVE